MSIYLGGGFEDVTIPPIWGLNAYLKNRFGGVLQRYRYDYDYMRGESILTGSYINRKLEAVVRIVQSTEYVEVYEKTFTSPAKIGMGLGALTSTLTLTSTLPASTAALSGTTVTAAVPGNLLVNLNQTVAGNIEAFTELMTSSGTLQGRPMTTQYGETKVFSADKGDLVTFLQKMAPKNKSHLTIRSGELQAIRDLPEGSRIDCRVNLRNVDSSSGSIEAQYKAGQAAVESKASKIDASADGAMETRGDTTTRDNLTAKVAPTTQTFSMKLLGQAVVNGLKAGAQAAVIAIIVQLVMIGLSFVMSDSDYWMLTQVVQAAGIALTVFSAVSTTATFISTVAAGASLAAAATVVLLPVAIAIAIVAVVSLLVTFILNVIFEKSCSGDDDKDKKQSESKGQTVGWVGL